jgi:hypothetical protein
MVFSFWEYGPISNKAQLRPNSDEKVGRNERASADPQIRRVQGIDCAWEKMKGAGSGEGKAVCVICHI